MEVNPTNGDPTVDTNGLSHILVVVVVGHGVFLVGQVALVGVKMGKV